MGFLGAGWPHLLGDGAHGDQPDDGAAAARRCQQALPVPCRVSAMVHLLCLDSTAPTALPGLTVSGLSVTVTEYAAHLQGQVHPAGCCQGADLPPQMRSGAPGAAQLLLFFVSQMFLAAQQTHSKVAKPCEFVQ